MTKISREQLSLPVDFILCMERTGSSMLAAMFNSNPVLLSPSEEPFILYFYPAYKNKKIWTEKEVDSFIFEFKRLAEKNLDLYFSSFDYLRNSMLTNRDNLDFQSLVRLVYFHFYPLKGKDNVKRIIDKQIKFIFYPEEIIQILPDAKFLVMVRDYRDVICSWKKRGLGSNYRAAFVARIWKISYSGVLKTIKKYPGKFMVCRYEELIADPEKNLKSIMNFFNSEFVPAMLNYDITFRKYIDDMKDKVSEKYLSKIEDFHSNTLTPLNPSLAGEWKNKLSKREILVAEKIAGNTGLEFGYIPVNKKGIRLSVVEFLSSLRAYWEKKIYLHLYVRFPFRFKVWLKKLRPNKWMG